MIAAGEAGIGGAISARLSGLRGLVSEAVRVHAVTSHVRSALSPVRAIGDWEHERREAHAPHKADSLAGGGGHGAVELMLIHGQVPFLKGNSASLAAVRQIGRRAEANKHAGEGAKEPGPASSEEEARPGDDCQF
jgi:hypothetical protein